MKAQQFILSMILAINLNALLACSCSKGNLELPLGELGLLQTKTSNISNFGDLIFMGKLLSISATTEAEDGNFRDLVFTIKKLYKGMCPDTIKVRTRSTSDACGFSAPPSTDCLIFTSKMRDGLYHTFRSDCCKSIAKAHDEKTYLKYITFLDAITEGIDGNYSFFQSHALKHAKIKNLPDTLETLRFEIKNGQLEGLWKLMDNEGNVLEEGMYRRGKKHGKWTVCSYINVENDNYGDLKTETAVTRYQMGNNKSQNLRIVDRRINWETGFYETTRIQVFRSGKLIQDKKPKEGSPIPGLPSSKNSAKS